MTDIERLARAAGVYFDRRSPLNWDDVAAIAAQARREALEDVNRLRNIGARMANVMYNLAQPETAFDADVRKVLHNLRVEWDVTVRALASAPFESDA